MLTNPASTRSRSVPAPGRAGRRPQPRRTPCRRFRRTDGFPAGTLCACSPPGWRSSSVLRSVQARRRSSCRLPLYGVSLSFGSARQDHSDTDRPKDGNSTVRKDRGRDDRGFGRQSLKSAACRRKHAVLNRCRQLSGAPAARGAAFMSGAALALGPERSVAWFAAPLRHLAVTFRCGDVLSAKHAASATCVTGRLSLAHCSGFHGTEAGDRAGGARPRFDSEDRAQVQENERLHRPPSPLSGGANIRLAVVVPAFGAG